MGTTEAAEHIEIDVTGMICAAIAAQAEKASDELAQAFALPEETPAGEYLRFWNTTPEEVARINSGDLEAVNAFYFRNELHIKYAVYAFFRKNRRFKTIIELYDLMHQFYIDMATGAVKLRPWDKAICRSALYSFRYAAIGGAGNYGTIYIPFKEKMQCLKQAN